MIPISVIIPTHNRVLRLEATLDALQHQCAVHDHEVIVVADGCTDSTVQLLRHYRSMFPFKYIENLQARGAAAARNAGAAQAHGRILLFLDDDMDASKTLLAAHLAAHRDFSDRVVLGYFPMQPPGPDDDPFTMGARLWWAENFTALSERGHRFTLKDLCTGNVSLPRSLFERVGGFDENMDSSAAGEDYELGYRLIQSGARFQFAREAASIHHTRLPMSVSLRRAEQEGVGQAILTRRHPELFWEFNVSRLSRIAEHNNLLRPFWRAMWACPRSTVFVAAVLRGLVSILAFYRIYSLLWRFYRPLRGYYYWKGVRTVYGSFAAWERLAQDAPAEKPGNEIDIDLPDDLHRLDYLAGKQRVDSVRVWCKGVPVGRIPPRAGAEPLTADHIRVLLMQRFSGVLFGILVEELATAKTRQHQPQSVAGLSVATRASE